MTINNENNITDKDFSMILINPKDNTISIIEESYTNNRKFDLIFNTDIQDYKIKGGN